MEKTRIALDPGHGHNGSLGATAKGFVEADIVRRIAEQAQNYLSLHPCLAVRLTRTTDDGASYQDRARTLERWSPDLVICLHCDSSPDENARGSFALAMHDNALGAECAKVMLHTMPQALEPSKPQAFQALSTNWTARAYRVLAHYRQWPSFLVELGRMSNADDLRELVNGKNDLQICHAIASAGMRRRDQITRGLL